MLLHENDADAVKDVSRAMYAAANGGLYDPDALARVAIDTHTEYLLAQGGVRRTDIWAACSDEAIEALVIRAFVRGVAQATAEAYHRGARDGLTKAVEVIGEEETPVGAWDNDYTRGRDNGKYVAARAVRTYRDSHYPETEDA